MRFSIEPRHQKKDVYLQKKRQQFIDELSKISIII